MFQIEKTVCLIAILITSTVSFAKNFNDLPNNDRQNILKSLEDFEKLLKEGANPDQTALCKKGEPHCWDQWTLNGSMFGLPNFLVPTDDPDSTPPAQSFKDLSRKRQHLVIESIAKFRNGLEEANPHTDFLCSNNSAADSNCKKCWTVGELNYCAGSASVRATASEKVEGTVLY